MTDAACHLDEPSHGLHPTTWMVLRALRSGARLSRNRNYDLFADPRARRAIKLHRYLESIIRDVRACEDRITVSAVGTDDGETAGEIALRLDFPLLHGHRTCYLTQVELELIAEVAPEVAERLATSLTEG